MKPYTFLAVGFALATTPVFARETEPTEVLAEKAFQKPPHSALPHTWWHWMNGYITHEGITADLEAMSQAGIGGAQIFNVEQGTPPGKISYMSPEWRQAMVHAGKEAKRLGMELCFHNCAGWSSSGGPWITPEHSMQVLTWSETTVKGGEKLSLTLNEPEKRWNYYNDIAVLAVKIPAGGDKVRLDNIRPKAFFERGGDWLGLQVKGTVSEGGSSEGAIPQTDVIVLQCAADGKLTWDAPAGDWLLIRMGHTTTGAINAPAPKSGEGLESDKLSREATDLHWEKGVAPVLADMGPELVGKVLNNALIDSYEVGSQNWTPKLREEFTAQHGYDPLPWMPVVTGRVIASPEQSERFLWDWRRTIADLFVKNYIGRFKELCHQNQMLFSVEPYGSGPFDNLQSGMQGDILMGEFWLPNGHASATVKIAASCAHVMGRNIVGAESFTSDENQGRWQVEPYGMKALGDRMFAQGVNRYILHRYAHQPWPDLKPGMTMGRWGSHFERTQTWWNQAGTWLNYVARCQYLLQAGRFSADVLTFCGDDAPNDIHIPKLPAGYDYDGCDRTTLMTAKAEQGDLVMPSGARYKVLMIPDSIWLTPETTAKLVELNQAGVKIVGRKPEKSPSLVGYPESDAKVKALAAQLTLTTLDAALPAPDVVLPDGAPLVWLHRTTPDAEIYFVSNQQYSPQKATVGFRVTGRTPEFWHPETGTVEAAPVWTSGPTHTNVTLALGPAESVFVVFGKGGKPGKNYAKVERAGGDSQMPKPPVVEILSARYEAIDGAGGTDVTTKLKELVANGQNPIIVSNDHFGEPAFMHPKHLKVSFTLDGKAKELTAGEAETLNLLGGGPELELPEFTITGGKLLAYKPGTYSFTDPDGAMTQITAPALRETPLTRWQLAFPDQKVRTLPDLISWTEFPEPAAKYFSGTATYQTKFTHTPDSTRAVILDLGRVKNFADVILNGQPVATLWKAPWRLDITDKIRPGSNTLQVKVTNLWVNRLIGDEQLPPEEGVEWTDKVGPIKAWPQWLIDGKPRPATERVTFSSWRFWNKEDKPLESGLLGPARILHVPALPLASATPVEAKKGTARFEPPAGKVLVFAGQDNASVGGTAKFSDGYVDNVGVPGGITHYVYFSEGWTNGLKRTFAMGSVAGLNTETEWGSGPMHQKAYVDSPKLAPCVMHVSISMEGNCEDKVADGSFDHLIAEFVKFIADHPKHPFLIRIGYEFDGSWNAYDAENFKKAFRRIVDALRAAKLTNYAIVMASSGYEPQGKWEEYWPGDDYVDWVGYSYWGQVENEASVALAFARKVGKPVFIAEASPRGIFFNKEDHQAVWNRWFEKFFKHIDDNIDVVRAVSYINADWDAQDMWDGWGQSRIETAPLIKTRWLEKMAEPRFVNADDKPFEVIGFTKSAAGANNNVEPYRDLSRPVDERVKDLLGRMNIQEKVAQLHSWWNHDERKLLSDGAIFTPEFYGSVCPNGVGTLGPLHNLTIDDDVRMYAAVQEYFRKRTRLGIPALIHGEAAHGFMRFEANSFPAPVALSCTWNPELMERIYTQTAREARNRGINQVLAPVVDIARDLRWGRVDETPGEDAFLAGRIGAAIVRGLQGSADGSIAPEHVAATLKHFAGYAGTVGGLNRSPYPNGPRHLLDNEVEPFRHAIAAAKPTGVMAAYNEIEGLPGHVNPWLLTDVLRGKLGFEGIVVGDYQGVDLVRQYQKIGTSDADAARMAFDAGLQMELPNNFGYQHLPGLVEQGKIKIEQIDHAVTAVLALKFRLGLFEAPMTIDPAVPKAITSAPAATELAREAARQAIVLLKNENNLLPFAPGAHKNIAVIGPNADVCRLGSYSGKPLKTVSLLAGVKDFLGDKANVTHATGCKIAHNDTGVSYDNWRYIDDIQYASLDDNRPLIAEAVEMAKNSDLVILALGHSELLGREAWGANHIGDRSTLDLTDSEKALAEEILATGKPVVLFLNNGKPITLHQLNDRIPAILTAHYAGQETGTAAAEILFGQTNPSGKLTITWPRDIGHLPVHYSQQSSARVFNYLNAPTAPIYPFGHGLSYTQFAYGNPQLSANQIRPGESVTVSVDITNTGSKAGTEIVQVYVTGEEFEIARPRLELKGFARITMNPGETKKAEIQIAADDLHFHNQKLERVLPRGKYHLRVGGSSEALGQNVTLETVPEAARL